ncbi:ATP-binding cassette domain-containing protein [Agitococcus lubricus]|uniref:Phospholipid/cholesterol/gamma-HCH transport system ATP-binding protein n=1 Tax=Agitococcus lubricus TaxID=1077255 RepID=A0A2T5J0Z0_9GAMM|nr:ATP-binding cassette domain-containing protein [Agitococcus lubricus]PTQ89911.1 phospholipid/cholesterol/gamma-HCH transport system ATP-binding protein [Agitococcus lubricus]
MSSLTDSVLVSIRNLSFSRGDRVIYDNVSLDVARGKVTAIMGPSGCGKTTLLRFIGGQLYPDQGQVLVNGQDVPQMSRRELFSARAKMGMLFQSGALFSDLSVYENVAFPLRAHTKLPETLIHELVLMKLEAVGLRGAVHLMPAELSGGMQRRAALARAIALDPELIMYDEPFAGQDPIVKGVLVTLIRTLREALGLTSIIVSHDVPETLHIADYIYIIANKTIIGQGTPEELRHSESPFVQQFLTGSPDGPVRFHYPAPSFSQELGGVQ